MRQAGSITHSCGRGARPRAAPPREPRRHPRRTHARTPRCPQGEAGTNWYVVEKGSFDAFKKMEGDEEPGKKVKSYEAGGSFGELALMYNQRRAAVRALAPMREWGGGEAAVQAPTEGGASSGMQGGRPRSSMLASDVTRAARLPISAERDRVVGLGHLVGAAGRLQAAHLDGLDAKQDELRLRRTPLTRARTSRSSALTSVTYNSRTQRVRVEGRQQRGQGDGRGEGPPRRQARAARWRAAPVARRGVAQRMTSHPPEPLARPWLFSPPASS